MKKYIVFKGDNYYPNGGMLDAHGCFDSFGDAVISLACVEADWAHILNTETMQINWIKGTRPKGQ